LFERAKVKEMAAPNCARLQAPPASTAAAEWLKKGSDGAAWRARHCRR
jgi:hypothetical protein